MARTAGAKIGDTSGFGPWLVKTKLDGRSAEVIRHLKQVFYVGVEEGEGRVETATPESLYKGVTIRRVEAGYRTSLDPESEFESLQEAKRFVDAQAQRNPRRRGLYGAGVETLAAGMSMGSREDPFLWPSRGMEVYLANGFWWYRNADPTADPFVRQWLRVTDPSFKDEISYALRTGELTSKEGNPSRRDKHTLYSLLDWKAMNFGFERATSAPTMADVEMLVSEQTTLPVPTAIKRKMLESASRTWKVNAINIRSNPDTPRYVPAEDDWPLGAIKWTVIDTHTGHKVTTGKMWVRVRTRTAAEKIADKLNRKRQTGRRAAA